MTHTHVFRGSCMRASWHIRSFLASIVSFSRSCSLSLSLYFALSISLALSLTFPLLLFLYYSLCLSPSLSLFLSLSLSLSVFLSSARSFPASLSPSSTHTRTHTKKHTHTLSFTHKNTNPDIQNQIYVIYAVGNAPHARLLPQLPASLSLSHTHTLSLSHTHTHTQIQAHTHNIRSTLFAICYHSSVISSLFSVICHLKSKTGNFDLWAMIYDLLFVIWYLLSVSSLIC